MNLYVVVITALGGLGMFVFGMKTMSDGLQKAAGDKLRSILETISSNRVIGCIMGALITALVQSSSLTTVTVVGFVNAGLMNLTQAVGVILGANIGTTVTAQIIAFKIDHLALLAMFLGTALKLFAKRRKWRFIGEVILGFGLLFYGMTVMKAGFKPLRAMPEFISFFTMFDATSIWGILLCVVTGAGLTMLVQSSSATVGITLALASQGLLPFTGAVALILGENIGTTITAELASIGGSLAARRAARAHTMFNVIGVGLMLILFHPFIYLVDFVTGSLMGYGPADALVNGEKPNIARYIANAHTLFNLCNAMFFLMVLPMLVRVAEILTPGVDDQDYAEQLGRTEFIDYKVTGNPEHAMNLARKEIVRMGKIAQEMLSEVSEAFYNREFAPLKRGRKLEKVLDHLQRQLIEYLVRVSQSCTQTDQSHQVNALMRITNNIERIGDSVENILENIEDIIEDKLAFSTVSLDDYDRIRTKTLFFLEESITAIKENKMDFKSNAKDMENEIDELRAAMRDSHIARLRDGKCSLGSGLIFVNLLNNFEKIGDYCYNVATALSGKRKTI